MPSPQFGGSFTPKVKTMGWNPISAPNSQKHIEQRTQQQVNNLKAQAIAAQRNAKMEMLGHQLNKSQINRDYQTANAQFAADEAKNNAKFSTIKGVLGIVGTASSFGKQIQAHQAQEAAKQAQIADENMLLESVGWGMDSESVQYNEQEQQVDQMNEIGIQADAQANVDTAKNYADSGTATGLNTSNILQETSAYKALEGINGNIYTARATHSAFLAQAIRELTPEQRAGGYAQHAQIVAQLNRQFIIGAGLQGASRDQMVRLARTMAGNSQNAIAGMTKDSVRLTQQENQTQAANFSSTLVEGFYSGAIDAQEAWDKVAERFAYGNLGFNGYSAASNEAALRGLLSQVVSEGKGPGMVNALRNVLKGSGPAAVPLGKEYDHLFDEAEMQALKQANSQWSAVQAGRKRELRESVNFYYNDPTPENRQAAVNQLRAIGTEDSLREANRISQNGMGYDPDKAFELRAIQRDGGYLSTDTLNDLLNNGTISPNEYKSLIKGATDPKLQRTVGDAIKAQNTQIRSSLEGNVAGGTTAPPSRSTMTSSFRSELNQRNELFKNDLKNLVFAELRSNPEVANDPKELQKVINEKQTELLKRPEYTLRYDPKESWSFGADVYTDKNLTAFTTSPGRQDFTSLSQKQFHQMQVPVSEMDPLKDRFMSTADLKNDVKAIIDGGAISPRARYFADRLGLSPKAFVDAQLKRLNLPSVDYMRQRESQGSAMKQTGGSGISGNDIPDMASGFKYLQSVEGFPPRGAAYLASAINSESAWRGQREWGQVAGDGTNRNGGLISWASWSHDAARLGQIEKHFGRSISQISEPEQLAYMKLEMKRSYPKAYRIFNNPNASSADLRWATANYWGFDPTYTGSRWTDAERLISRGR